MSTRPARLGARLTAGLLGAALIAGLSGCGDVTPARADGRLSVVTSFYPLQWVTQRIAGDSADVRNLTHPGQEPHDIELTVPETAELSTADLVVYERGFQANVDEAVRQNGPAHVIDVSASAGLSGDDPHFWLDPMRLSRVAGAVERRLAAVQPARTAQFEQRLARLRRQLSTLDRSWRDGLANCSTRTIVVSHDAFGYLGRRYGLKVVGINGLSPDAEPSASHLRTISDLIRSDGITTVFSERLASRRFADSLAGDLGIETAVLDPIEGLSDATADQDYLSLMRENLAALERSDSCA